MLLDRIDIDAHGPLSRVELGPFSEHLNVVCGPEGSGKTAVARFVRDSLVDRRYPLGMMSSSTGRVVWADRNGLVHCRREQDGTSEGRRTIEFETRGSHPNHFGSLRDSWIEGATNGSDASRAAAAIQLPESIIDCVITDTAVTNVARVVSACIRNGLDSAETYRSLPLSEDRRHTDRNPLVDPAYHSLRDDRDHNRAFRAQLADVEAELARLETTQLDYDALIARRNELTSRLSFEHRSESYPSSSCSPDETGWPHPDSRIASLTRRANQLRRHQDELRRWIAELDAELSRMPSGRHAIDVTNYRETRYRTHAQAMDSTLRRRLGDLDAQMIHWRRTLMEVRGLRDVLLRTQRSGSYYTNPVEDVVEKRRRLDRFLHSVDRYDRQRSWPHYETLGREYLDPAASRIDPRAEDIESRIEAATRQIDWLLQRYTDDSVMQDWYRTVPRETAYRSTSTLAETLRAIRRDLCHVADNSRRQYGCYRSAQQRVPYHSAPNRLGPNHADPEHGAYSEHSSLPEHSSHPEHNALFNRSSELGELNDCERWLVAAIDQLVGHRHALLNGFAARESVEQTGWDIHLWDAAEYAEERGRRLTELDQITSQLDSCVRELAEYRQPARSVPSFRESFRGSSYGQERYGGDYVHDNDLNDESIRSELRQVDESLAAYSRLHWLRGRREQLLDRLRVVRRDVDGTRSPLADEASRWLVRLSAGRLRSIEWEHARYRNWNKQPSHMAGSAGDATNQSVDADGAGYVDRTGVRIDGQNEANCVAADRALAVLAVRLAAGDLLARLGRAVPLVIETQRELLTSIHDTHSNPYSLRGYDHEMDGTPLAFYQYGDDRYSNHPIAAALHDYSRAGRQVVVLTSDASLTDQIARSGGHAFNLRAEHVVHPHRPIWRPQYAPEKYAGPHPHTYGDVTARDYRVPGDRPEAPLFKNEYAPPSYRDYRYGHDGYVHRGGNAWTHPVAREVNRNFDVAWREAYGFFDNPESPIYQRPNSADGVTTDGPHDGIDYRDGYFFHDAYTTVTPGPQEGFVFDQHATQPGRPFDNAEPSGGRPKRVANKKPENPFFLTVDSPIDQAPSVDAVAAARLRGLGVTHINHLMQQDSNRLSDALGLANVDAATIRRWQSECRLVCRVPQLRGFDARILVGTGITDPAQLAGTDPTDLLDRVEAFLATERGQRVLLSGSSYELSRITSWIASANNPVGWRDSAGRDRNRYRRARNGARVDAYGIREDDDFDRDRYEYEHPTNGYSDARGRGRRIRTVADINRDLNEIDPYETSDSNSGSRGQSGHRSKRRNRKRSGSRVNADRSSNRSGNRDPATRNYVRIAEDRVLDEDQHRHRNAARENEDGRGRRRSRSASQDHSRSGRSRKSSRSRSSSSRDGNNGSRRSYEDQTERTLRFYLQRDSDVVDAPSIGARMAERLNAIGIHTVDDLLRADPESVAGSLGHRRIDSDVVLAWQQQAMLVCRVPMLRGHDAQLLVVAEVTSPEELAAYEADELFALIDPISRSREGKRVLRGGNLPDLAEVTDWIRYAQHHRELMAA